jgi:starch synthase (maltosyl-transferring)
VFREGHEMLGAAVVLTDPAGVDSPLLPMRELAPGTDRYGAEVTPDREGSWQFRVEAWGDPLARWHHDASIKVPIGQDVELMLTEGARLLDRAAANITAVANLKTAADINTAGSTRAPASVPSVPSMPPMPPMPPVAPRVARAARKALAAAARQLTDEEAPPMARLAAAASPEVTAAVAAFPLRELLTCTERFPLVVHRQRALYGAWYESFPRSEGAEVDPTHRSKPRSGTLRTAAGRWPRSWTWASTWCTCHRCTRSARPRARGATTC